MKPQFHKVPLFTQNSYFVKHDVKSHQGSSWHYHPEMELVYIIRGEGVRYIGENISNFQSGEIVLLGENIPHLWKYDEQFLKNNDMQAESLAIFFRPDCLGNDLLNLQEAYLLPKLFEKAKSGLLVKGGARAEIEALMKKAADAANLERIIIFLSILKILAETSETEPISINRDSMLQPDKYDKTRLNEICNYTFNNFNKEITLEEISSIGHLSITSFCRYFKSMTKKTYYNFLNEVRVSQACKLLIEDKFPTNIICYECGFNNVSNFYRHFKKVTGVTPFEYKRKYLS